MKKVFILLMLGLALVVTACGSTSGEKGSANQTEVAGVSRGNPLLVDQERQTVTVYTEVNGKYFTAPTRHGVVFKDGSNGNKSVLRSWANQLDFYRGLVDIGAVPGNNVTFETQNAAAEGSELEIKVTWQGADREYAIAEVIKDEFGKGFMPRFGGNKERSADKQTGCIFCLDSCPVGITSNAAYPQGSFDGGTAEFFGNQDLLPVDGTPVAVIFSLK